MGRLRLVALPDRLQPAVINVLFDQGDGVGSGNDSDCFVGHSVAACGLHTIPTSAE